MNVSLLSSKKCPHCQQWSQWQQQADDRCEHCHQLLDPRASQDAHDHAQREQQTANLLRLDLNPEDGPGTRFFKRLSYGGQILFAAIMSVLVSLAASLAA